MLTATLPGFFQATFTARAIRGAKTSKRPCYHKPFVNTSGIMHLISDSHVLHAGSGRTWLNNLFAATLVVNTSHMHNLKSEHVGRSKVKCLHSVARCTLNTKCVLPCCQKQKSFRAPLSMGSPITIRITSERKHLHTATQKPVLSVPHPAHPAILPKPFVFI